MNYDHILIRYGELALKGKNKKEFLNTLIRNIRRQIKNDMGISADIIREQGRIILNLDGKDPESFYPSLNRIFGIVSYSPVRRVSLDPDEIIATCIEEAKDLTAEEKAQAFRVSVKRANKQFPVQSPKMENKIAVAILDAFPEMNPDLKNYVLEISCDIRFDYAYVYLKKNPGLGGLPLGTGGRGMLLLSGGIDSPVAGWSLMRRGMVVEAIHFHSYPYTSKEAEEKVLTLAKKMAAYGGRIIVHLVSFTGLQEAIALHGHENLRITLMRRYMLRIAERMAHIRHAKAIITGDNLGQVASQTIESIYTINAVTNMPIFRPLIAFDKQEIMDIAKKIDTYETSILPYEDCCTVFVPNEPKTKPRIDICERDEKAIDADDMIDKVIAECRTYVCYSDGSQKPYEVDWQKDDLNG